MVGETVRGDFSGELGDLVIRVGRDSVHFQTSPCVVVFVFGRNSDRQEYLFTRQPRPGFVEWWV